MEKRTRSRLLAQKAVTVNGTLRAHCFDISYEGMYVHTDAEFKLNDVVTLGFLIEDKEITSKASIRHLEPGFGFGAKFLEMKQEDKMLLERFLPSESLGGNGSRVALLISESGKNSPAYKYKLQQDQFSVMEATDGNEAFRVLQSVKPGIVVLDIQIGGLSAFKIIQFMKTKAELRDVPVIIFASRFIAEEADKLYALGVNDFLVRAVTPPKLLSERIKQLLKG